MQQTAKTIKHSGMSDASAAEPLLNKRFIVAGDEFNVFKVYDAMNAGPPQIEIDFNKLLGIKNPKHEADIEGSARLNNLVYWIGSHARNGAGELKWKRHQFFATEIIDDGENVEVRQYGTAYTGLIVELLRYHWFQKLTLERLDPQPDPKLAAKCLGSINIEGLAAFEDGLLLGFRNPIPDNQALLIPFINPHEVIRSGAHPQFEKPIRLDLGGRGIRSIDYSETRNQYIITSGSFDTVSDFEFFSWSGPGHEPTKLNIETGLNPEAIVIFDDLAEFLVISDDGGEQAPGENSPFKDIPEDEQEFRTEWCHLPLQNAQTTKEFS